MNKKFSLLAFALLMGATQAFADVDPRMEQGARFEAQGNYEMALGEYRAILAEQPKNADAYFAAAEVRMKMKDYSGALANYRLAYKFEPKMSAAYEGAAKVYEALGQKGKAEAERAKDPKNNPVAEESVAAAPAEAVEAAAPAAPAAPAVKEEPKVEPKAEPASVAKAEPVKEEKKAEVAKESAPVAKAETKAEPAVKDEAKEASKTESKDPFERGKALLAEGNYKEAALAWREVLKKTPGHAGAYFYAGITRFEMGDMEKAEFNLKKGLEYKEEGNDANYYLARVYEKMGKRDQEKKFLAAYLKKAGPGGKYRSAIEDRLNAIKADEAAKAEEKESAKVAESAAPAEAAKPAEVAAVETAAPAGEDPAEVVDALVGEPSIANANMLFKAGSFEPALQMYKTLLEVEQTPDERYFTMLQMGNIYREMRDFHSAVTRYREVVQQFPDSDWATEAERALEDAVWLEKHAKDLPSRKR